MPRIDGAPPPKAGPGCAVPEQLAKRRFKKKVVRRVSAKDDNDDGSFSFMDDLQTPALKQKNDNVVSTVKKKKKKTPVLREDSSDDEEGANKKTKAKSNDAAATKSSTSNAQPKTSSKTKKATTKNQKPNPPSPATATKKKTVSMVPILTPKNSSSTPPNAVTALKAAPQHAAAAAAAAAPPLQDLPPPNRTAIAFDTRFIDTPEGRDTGTQLLDEYETFLACLESRGATPCVIASSVPKPKANRTAAQSVRQRNMVAVQIGEWKDGNYETNEGKIGIPSTWIAPPLNNENVNRKAVHVPKPLLAYDSWKYFGAIVEAIIEQDCKIHKTSGATKKPRPLDVYIVTNDLALFCDVKDASHKRYLGTFWDGVKDGTLRTIHVVVAKTGILALAKPPQVDDDTAAAEDSPDKDDKEARHVHEVAIANCIRVLHAQLKAKAETDYRFHRSYTNPVPPVEITISMIDATARARLGFKSLLRRCLRDIVDSVSASVMPPTATSSAVMQLELPKTSDDTQCSVSFALRYKLVPFALDKPITSNGFFHDLKQLAASKLEIVQLVPLACVDAALLYGIPMEVRAALLDDRDQYQVMLVLVRCLFRTMQQEQNAMLLRIADEDENGDGDDEKGVFHNSRRGQLFLLMANETVGGGVNPSLSTGVLFRYASADEFLLEPENPRNQVDTSVVTEELEEEYESYMDNCMALLEPKGVNPLYLDAVANSSTAADSSKPSYNPGSSPPPNEDTRWNDDTGVGALVAGGRGDDEMSMDEDDDCVTFEYD